MRNKTNQFLTQEEIQIIESKGITLNDEIIKSEDGIRMVVEILETISKDRKEFSRYFHYLKAENDRESQLISAYRKGMAQGIEQCMAQGIVQGKEQGKIDAAINMIKKLQMKVSEAMEITMLSEENKAELTLELEKQQVPYIE